MVVAAALSAAALSAAAVPLVRARFRLARAKHPSLHGHTRTARWLASLVPAYEFSDDRFFASDDAPSEVAQARREGFERLAESFQRRSPATIRATDALEPDVSDLQFTTAYRVPFQYRGYANRRLKIGALLRETDGVVVTDLDGRAAYDLAGSYGVNVFGYEFYRECVDAGIDRVRGLGPLLGAFHPVVADNVARLKAISGMDEVSFHMSGTEAVMQAVRLARFHTRRSHVVRFCGAYHGWWDDVQPGVGTPRTVRDVYTLRDLHPASLEVLRTRRDVACVLVNPLQALHPNAQTAGDGSLVAGGRCASFDRDAYTAWLRDLRRVCTERAIPLIFDEVFVGFRLARGGAQEYFGVAADLVTYGKTVGGGLPVGVLCGRRRFMKRFRDERPSDICFARGTFNSHPYVMGAMNEFLRRLDDPALTRSYEGVDEIWNRRAAALNTRLERDQLPLRVANLASIWTVCHLAPSRYNWMLQYYLRAEGLALAWVGSGRLIFSHDYSEHAVQAVADRFVAAARGMRADGWWWHPPAATNAAIRRRILGEMLAARVSHLWPVRRPDSGRWDPATRPASHAPAPYGRAAHRETGR
jgi:glutamate-1-semialdehyde 2,1-aminomutase